MQLSCNFHRIKAPTRLEKQPQRSHYIQKISLSSRIPCSKSEGSVEDAIELLEQNPELIHMLDMEAEDEKDENLLLLDQGDDDDEEMEFNTDPDHRCGYVALIGLPNVGKSTLLNSLIGERLSIVTQKAQTTRNRVYGIVSDDKHQIVLLDNPGLLRRTQHRLHERMMTFIRRSVTESDVVLIIVDLSDSPEKDLEMIQLPEEWTGPPMGVVLNKMDLVSQEDVSIFKDWYIKNCRCMRLFLTNARLGEGVDEVKEWLFQQLPLGPALYPKDYLSHQNERFFVGEIIREHIFLRFEEEIPYSVQVNVLEYKYRPGKKDYISVEIVTERPTQKAILLGKGGSAIRALGLAARRELERFLETQIYLELSVRVEKGWRKNIQLLNDFGY
eukprot:g9102.t1